MVGMASLKYKMNGYIFEIISVITTKNDKIQL